MAISAQELKASLEVHNSEFEELLRLIPAKYYLAPEDNGEYTSKYQKNSKKIKAPKQAIKEASKKAKRDKLDPANNKTIVELQEEAAASKKNNSVRSKGKKGKARETSDDEDQEAGEAGSDANDLDLEMDVDEMAVDMDDNDSENPDKSDVESKKTKKDKPVEYKPMEAPTSIEALRSKLRARMEELRQKNRRKSNNPGGGGEEMSSKDDLLEERRKQRAAMREKRRKETKEKKRREEEERKRKGKEKQQSTSGQSANNQLLVPDPSHPSTSGTPSGQTTIAFSSLTGSKPHIPKSLKTPSNPALALSHVQSHLSTLNALPASKREQVSTHEQYTKASARLSGAKIHDDPQRLAKSAKRREKEKEKSKKEWGKRKEEVVKAQAARQKKRSDNIAMRNEKRKGKGKGKGQKRPGFEGKSFGAGTSKKAGSSSKGKGRK